MEIFPLWRLLVAVRQEPCYVTIWLACGIGSMVRILCKDAEGNTKEVRRRVNTKC